MTNGLTTQFMANEDTSNKTKVYNRTYWQIHHGNLVGTM